MSLPFDPHALQAGVIIWPLLFGWGAYLLLTAQPIGRPKPDLAEQLRRLDVRERLRMQRERRDVQPIFKSRLLETMLRPVLDDAGRVLRSVLNRLGVGGGKEVERKLQVARPGVEAAQFFGEKLASGLVGFAIFPGMNWMGVHPFGVWPVWMWIMGFALGFVWPNWQLDRRLAARRTTMLMELPVILDMLTITVSAGLAPEQALAQVARQSEGAVADELRQAGREMALGQHSLVEALEAVARRNAMPELTSFVIQVRSALEQGLPLVNTLSAQAEVLRERKRLRIVEAGGKATVRMILPIALFILPVLFVLLLLPAAMQLLQLGR